MNKKYNKKLIFGLAYLLRYGYLAMAVVTIVLAYILQVGSLFLVPYLVITTMALHMVLSAVFVWKHFICAYQNIMGEEMNYKKKYKIEEIRVFQRNYIIAAFLMIVIASFILYFGI